MEILWTKLENFLQAVESKNTVETYYKICDQMGREIDPDKVPTDWTDFPNTVHVAVNMYNRLGDRIVADIGFLGKDYTLLPTLIELEEPDNIEFTLEIITWLENRAIKKSSEALKREHDKIKKKSRPKGGKGNKTHSYP